MKYRLLIFSLGLFALASCQVDAPKYNLGKGFYVTYVDLARLRGVYYQKQNVNGNVSVKSVTFNDSLILVTGYRFTRNGNPDTSVQVYYGIVKDIYRQHPDQTYSDGYLDINELQFRELSSRLRKSSSKEWTEW
ncbi:hypothetical protein [Polluticoccus soli]|uniref:hypothetical protein n=1 Tax=Polluticoccus soli TaxID=3034150 RepID=UPI0023E34348|nr:hypothetical protein [Flavipsychrobacter sp. JY13-12]